MNAAQGCSTSVTQERQGEAWCGAEVVGVRGRNLGPVDCVGQYLIAFRLLLDHVGIEPNLARDPRVKLPKQVREEPQPPSREHFEAIVEALGAKWKLCSSPSSRVRSGSARPCRFGGRMSTPPVYGCGCRGPRRSVTVPAGCTCPQWLMQAIEETCPLEDRVPERKVFQGITEASAYQAMSRACKNAKVPHYHPHDLRHRRITIWHQSGVPARELAERAGHARPSMSLDVYSHVMPPDEIESERFLSLLTDEESGKIR